MLFAEHGTELIVALASALTSGASVAVGFLTSREKQRIEFAKNQNQFTIDSLREVYKENANDKQDLIHQNTNLNQKIMMLEERHLRCEQDKKDIEVKIEGLLKEVDIVVACFNDPVTIKKLISATGRRNRNFFKHVNINNILREIETIPDRAQEETT